MKDVDEMQSNVTRVVIVMCITKFTNSFVLRYLEGVAGACSGPDPSIPLGREALRYAALATTPIVKVGLGDDLVKPHQHGVEFVVAGLSAGASIKCGVCVECQTSDV